MEHITGKPFLECFHIYCASWEEQLIKNAGSLIRVQSACHRLVSSLLSLRQCFLSHRNQHQTTTNLTFIIFIISTRLAIRLTFYYFHFILVEVEAERVIRTNF